MMMTIQCSYCYCAVHIVTYVAFIFMIWLYAKLLLNLFVTLNSAELPHQGLCWGSTARSHSNYCPQAMTSLCIWGSKGTANAADISQQIRWTQKDCRRWHPIQMLHRWSDTDQWILLTRDSIQAQVIRHCTKNNKQNVKTVHSKLYTIQILSESVLFLLDHQQSRRLQLVLDNSGKVVLIQHELIHDHEWFI